MYGREAVLTKVRQLCRDLRLQQTEKRKANVTLGTEPKRFRQFDHNTPSLTNNTTTAKLQLQLPYTACPKSSNYNLHAKKRTSLYYFPFPNRVACFNLTLIP